MRLKTLEEKYFIPTSIEDASKRVQEALSEVGLKNLAVRKYVPPRYLLVEYSPSWVGKAFEIELLFQEKDCGTVVEVKWPYAKELALKGESPVGFHKMQEESKRAVELLLQEFKRKIGAVNI